MKSVMTHGVLALVGLGLAYQTWTRPPESEAVEPVGTAVVLDCKPEQLTQIEFEAPTHKAVIVPAKEKEGTEYWITSLHKTIDPKKDDKASKKDEPKGDQAAAGSAAPATAGSAAPAPADAGAPAALAVEDEATKPARKYDPEAPFTFAASNKFDELLAWIAPLKASRALGQVDKKKLGDFGLDNVGTFLRVECGGKKVALDVGGRTFGSGDRYVRDQKTGEVYLLDGRKVTDMQSAQFRFMQSDMQDFTLEDIEEVTIKAAGKERRLLHRNRRKEDATWVDAADPDRRNELYGNWFQRLAQIKARAYLGPKDEPGADLQISNQGVKPVMTIDYKVEGKPPAKLEITRVDTKQGPMYYGRSSATHRWVALFESVAKQLEDDVALVVGAEEAPQQSVEPEPKQGAQQPPSAAPVMPPGHPPIPAH